MSINIDIDWDRAGFLAGISRQTLKMPKKCAIFPGTPECFPEQASFHNRTVFVFE